MPINVGTLCSGIGVPEKVFSGQAFSDREYEVLFCAEIDKFASAVLDYHYPHVPNLGDIEKIDGYEWEGKIDILVGGPPCQAFSIMGKGLALNDPRGQLTLEYVRLLKEIQPTIAIYENVPQILRAKSNPWGNFLASITEDDAPLRPNSEIVGEDEAVKWTNSGVVVGKTKNIAWTILDAQDYGIPQRRKRVWAVIVDTRKLAKFLGAPPEFDAARLSTVSSEILLDPESQRRTPPTQKGYNTSIARRSFAIGFSANDRGGDAGIELCPTIRSGSHDKSWPNSTGGGAAVAIFDRGAWEVRYLTPYEIEILSGLPAGYTQIPWKGHKVSPDGNRKTVLGNTMAVPCLEHIKLRIEKVLSSYVEFFKQEQEKKMSNTELLIKPTAELLIEPELEGFIPKLQKQEFEILEASILAEGCRDPLTVWQQKNCIVDGHNRYKICKKHNIPFKVEYLSFPDIIEAKVWMGTHQLGRRNLSEHSLLLTRGKLIGLLTRRKRGERRDQPGITNAELCRLLNIKTDKTIRDSLDYSKAIETLSDIQADISEKIEMGDLALTREEVVAIGHLAAVDKQMAQEFLAVPKIPDKRRLSQNFNERCREVREYVNKTYPTVEEQQELAQDPEKWIELKSVSNTDFDEEAWIEVGNSLRRQQLAADFSTKNEELEARGVELGLPKNFTKALEKSWAAQKQNEEPTALDRGKLEYELLPVDLSSYSDAALNAAIARLQKEAERRKDAINQLVA
jgi:DNA (cytosine-5)-methyltransferase 1